MINTLVIKSIRACNLRCPYCYYINEQTEKYGLVISEEYVRRLYAAYSTYISDKLREVYLIWHGGEPLLLGRKRFQRFLDLQKDFFPPDVVRNAVQTNGVLVDDDWLDFFDVNDIHVGVSLDGPQHTHDRYRVTPQGVGSYLKAVRAIQGLRQRGRAVGVISVVDGAADGAAAIDEFRRLGVQVCDFLIPMTNHARQRARRPRITPALPLVLTLIK